MFSSFAIPRFYMLMYDQVCIYDMKVKLSMGQRRLSGKEGEEKGKQKNGEICSTHNIYLYENFKNDFKKKVLTGVQLLVFISPRYSQCAPEK